MTFLNFRETNFRKFLLKHAREKDLTVHQHFSEGNFFCHIESRDKDRTATAVSDEGMDQAMAMAFLAFENSDYHFLDLESKSS